MLVGWDRLFCTDVEPTSTRRLHAITDTTTDSATIRATLRLATAEGRTLAVIEGAVLKRTDAGTWREPGAPTWIGRMIWAPAEVAGPEATDAAAARVQIGRASGRDRVCQYV